jgi:DNA-binding transcriptional regulator YiaG
MIEKEQHETWRLRLITMRKNLNLSRAKFCEIWKPWLTTRALEAWEYKKRKIPYLVADKLGLLDEVWKDEI